MKPDWKQFAKINGMSDDEFRKSLYIAVIELAIDEIAENECDALVIKHDDWKMTISRKEEK